MKEYLTYYINPNTPGLKLICPYQTGESIIRLEFSVNKPYQVIANISDDFSEVGYKIKSKSYYKWVYLPRETLDKYFITDKEYHKFFFDLKMNKLLK